MKKTILALALFASFVQAHAAGFDDQAQIVAVEENYSTGTARRQVCDGSRSSTSQSTDGNTFGALLGGVAGALLGAQMGNGNGKVAAAAIGAATGAYAGDRVATTGGQSGGNCYWTEEPTRTPNGWRITYRYNGRDFTEVTSVRPNYQNGTVRVRVNVSPAF